MPAIHDRRQRRAVGYYLLAQQDMNSPFDSEAPLTMDSAKLGLSVGF